MKNPNNKHAVRFEPQTLLVHLSWKQLLIKSLTVQGAFLKILRVLCKISDILHKTRPKPPKNILRVPHYLHFSLFFILDAGEAALHD